jgi:hypothetical protein
MGRGCHGGFCCSHSMFVHLFALQGIELRSTPSPLLPFSFHLICLKAFMRRKPSVLDDSPFPYLFKIQYLEILSFRFVENVRRRVCKSEGAIPALEPYSRSSNICATLPHPQIQSPHKPLTTISTFIRHLLDYTPEFPDHIPFSPSPALILAQISALSQRSTHKPPY